MGASDMVDMLLSGEYIPPSHGTLIKGAHMLLERLSNKEALPKISETIGFPDFVQALKKWREGTST
jgi:hypothetical protein